jgi:hypothetical protein
MRFIAATMLLLVIAGCGDQYRNHTECRKVADLIEGIQQRDLRAFDQMDTLTSQETMLMASVIDDPANAYKRCMEINR